MKNRRGHQNYSYAAMIIWFIIYFGSLIISLIAWDFSYINGVAAFFAHAFFIIIGVVWGHEIIKEKLKGKCKCHKWKKDTIYCKLCMIDKPNSKCKHEWEKETYYCEKCLKPKEKKVIVNEE